MKTKTNNNKKKKKPYQKTTNPTNQTCWTFHFAHRICRGKKGEGLFSNRTMFQLFGQCLFDLQFNYMYHLADKSNIKQLTIYKLHFAKI